MMLTCRHADAAWSEQGQESVLQLFSWKIIVAIMELGFMRVSLSPAYTATWQDAHRSLSNLLARPRHRFLPDDVSAIASPETSYKDTTDAHLVQLAKRHGMRLATLDAALIAQPWAKRIAINPIELRG